MTSLTPTTLIDMDQLTVRQTLPFLSDYQSFRQQLLKKKARQFVENLDSKHSKTIKDSWFVIPSFQHA